MTDHIAAAAIENGFRPRQLLASLSSLAFRRLGRGMRQHYRERQEMTLRTALGLSRAMADGESAKVNTHI